MSLRVMDFGGSLGSSYFQCRRFFPSRVRVEWSVVEQQDYVECGRHEFATDELVFFTDVDSCLQARRPDVLLLSSVLPYVERPYTLLETLVKKEFSTIIVDKTPFVPAGANDRLMVQKAEPDIYDATYPAWILDKGRFLAFMGEHYDCLSEFGGIGDRGYT